MTDVTTKLAYQAPLGGSGFVNEQLVVREIAVQLQKLVLEGTISKSVARDAQFETINDIVTRSLMYRLRTYLASKRHEDEWRSEEAKVLAPGIWNGIKAWAVRTFPGLLDYVRIDLDTVPTEVWQHRTVTYVCPHIGMPDRDPRTGKRSQLIHFQFLDTTPDPSGRAYRNRSGTASSGRGRRPRSSFSQPAKVDTRE